MRPLVLHAYKQIESKMLIGINIPIIIQIIREICVRKKMVVIIRTYTGYVPTLRAFVIYNPYTFLNFFHPLAFLYAETLAAGTYKGMSLLSVAFNVGGMGAMQTIRVSA